MTSDYRVGAPARFGAANVLRGLAASTTGQMISLNLELDDPNIPFGRAPFRRTMRVHNDLRPLGDGRHVVISDDEVSFALQGSSQWDAFAHFGMLADDGHSVYYDGHELNETYPQPSAAHLGIQALGPAVIARGVLLDLVAVAGGDEGFVAGNQRLSVAVLEDAIARQGVEILPGDAVLLYTGFERRRRSLGGAYPAEVGGLDGSSVTLWKQLDILALIADNVAVEANPADYSIHIGLLRDLGIPLGELWALEDLAAACREQNRHDFLLASVPLNIHGAFGSPANAVAVL